jgi:hypothetical protein
MPLGPRRPLLPYVPIIPLAASRALEG